MPFKECRFRRVGKAALQGLVVRNSQTVDQQFDILGSKQGFVCHYFLNTVSRIVDRQTGISLFLQDLQLFLHAPAFRQNDRGEHGKTGSRRIRQDLGNDIFHLVLLHLHTRHGRDRLADPGIKQPQVFINFRRCPHC